MPLAKVMLLHCNAAALYFAYPPPSLEFVHLWPVLWLPQETLIIWNSHRDLLEISDFPARRKSNHVSRAKAFSITIQSVIPSHLGLSRARIQDWVAGKLAYHSKVSLWLARVLTCNQKLDKLMPMIMNRTAWNDAKENKRYPSWWDDDKACWNFTFFRRPCWKSAGIGHFAHFPSIVDVYYGKLRREHQRTGSTRSK